MLTGQYDKMKRAGSDLEGFGRACPQERALEVRAEPGGLERASI